MHEDPVGSRTESLTEYPVEAFVQSSGQVLDEAYDTKPPR